MYTRRRNMLNKEHFMDISWEFMGIYGDLSNMWIYRNESLYMGTKQHGHTVDGRNPAPVGRW